MNLTASGLRFSSVQSSSNQGDRDCGAAARAGAGNTLPHEPCSLNDRDWFVILQARPAGALAAFGDQH
jgi:hypothetical protein